MKKLSILLICLVTFLGQTVQANDSYFAFDLSKEEGIKLLAGEKNIAIIRSVSPASKDKLDKLSKDVLSDIELKFRLIGLEPSYYEWGTPFLRMHFGLVDVGANRYSGMISLTYNMTAKYDKGGVRSYSTVWEIFVSFANTGEDSIRNSFKDIMDEFLSVYLEANPRKFIDTPKKSENDKKP